jgi:hypothetical protein
MLSQRSVSSGLHSHDSTVAQGNQLRRETVEYWGYTLHTCVRAVTTTFSTNSQTFKPWGFSPSFLQFFFYRRSLFTINLNLPVSCCISGTYENDRRSSNPYRLFLSSRWLCCFDLEYCNTPWRLRMLVCPVAPCRSRCRLSRLWASCSSDMIVSAKASSRIPYGHQKILTETTPEGVMSGIISATPFNDVFTATKGDNTMQALVTAIYELGG